ncbi:Uncharacterised protein [Raoultella terrigena]|uniref:Uncharacterized protein n=1 Tax=Raoultella terrigena TaxID=577 RepID=A0A4V6J1P9_RAOTE|nr:Uncharacterised protein [Raoultella terrigena]
MDSGSPLGVAIGGIIVAHLIVLLDSWRVTFVVVASSPCCWVCGMANSARPPD